MRRPTPALVIALIALFVALGGAGMAATGGNFILGKLNTADATSSLSAPVAGGSALNVSNLNTTAGSRALRLKVASGHSPFTVNSAVKVANLNADKLDGIDSTGFVRGVRGRGRFLANRIAFAPTASKPLLAIPGLGYLFAVCNSNVFGTSIYWVNRTASNVDAWSPAPGNFLQFFAVPPGGRVLLAFPASAGETERNGGGTSMLGVGSAPNPLRTALLHVVLNQSADGTLCTFQAQGTLWTSQ
jgi:hypothetical protein